MYGWQLNRLWQWVWLHAEDVGTGTMTVGCNRLTRLVFSSDLRCTVNLVYRQGLPWSRQHLGKQQILDHEYFLNSLKFCSQFLAWYFIFHFCKSCSKPCTSEVLCCLVELLIAQILECDLSVVVVCPMPVAWTWIDLHMFPFLVMTSVKDFVCGSLAGLLFLENRRTFDAQLTNPLASFWIVHTKCNQKEQVTYRQLQNSGIHSQNLRQAFWQLLWLWRGSRNLWFQRA